MDGTNFSEFLLDKISFLCILRGKPASLAQARHFFFTSWKEKYPSILSTSNVHSLFTRLLVYLVQRIWKWLLCAREWPNFYSDPAKIVIVKVLIGQSFANNREGKWGDKGSQKFPVRYCVEMALEWRYYPFVRPTHSSYSENSTFLGLDTATELSQVLPFTPHNIDGIHDDFHTRKNDTTGIFRNFRHDAQLFHLASAESSKDLRLYAKVEKKNSRVKNFSRLKTSFEFDVLVE